MNGTHFQIDIESFQFNSLMMLVELDDVWWIDWQCFVFFSLFETDMEFAGIFGLFRISESVAIGARVHELVAWFL